MGRELLPLLLEGGEELLYVIGELAAAQLIGLGEYYAERDGVLAEPLYELQVYLLGLVSAVYQYEQRGELGTLQYVVVDYFGELVLLALAALSARRRRK